MTVVRPGAASETAAAVATAETVLDGAAARVAGAEVAVDSQTRVAENTAGGIASAAVENRVSTVLLGWDGADARPQTTFGGTIDRVLQQTTQQVVVARARGPLNVAERLVLVLPPNIDHNDGFDEAVGSVKTLARELEADLHAYTVAGDPQHYRSLLERGPPDTPVEVHRVDGWDDVGEVVGGTTADDFVVLMSARRGRLGWDSELQRLPKRIATGTSGNFAVVYPRVEASDDERRFLEL